MAVKGHSVFLKQIFHYILYLDTSLKPGPGPDASASPWLILYSL